MMNFRTEMRQKWRKHCSRHNLRPRASAKGRRPELTFQEFMGYEGFSLQTVLSSDGKALMRYWESYR